MSATVAYILALNVKDEKLTQTHKMEIFVRVNLFTFYCDMTTLGARGIRSQTNLFSLDRLGDCLLGVGALQRV